MLDDSNVLQQRDPEGALQVAAAQYKQAAYDITLTHPEHDERPITRVVFAGMGGSALAALLVKSLINTSLPISFEVVRSYTLPAYVDRSTLVFLSSYSGNTEETISAYHDGRAKGAQLAVITSGGRLLTLADADEVVTAAIPRGLQPRMAVLYSLRAIAKLFAHFGVTGHQLYDEIGALSQWLHEQTEQWVSDVTTDKNYAKQLALLAVGKSAVFYGGPLTASLAYKWKISWNETGKNLSFWNEYSEFNHNEFMGWTSHPIEKPFVVFDLVSQLEHPQILKRMTISDRLLSGLRPKAHTIELAGTTLLQQLLWGNILADFVSIYLAVLNSVDPTPVALIEKLKKEL